MSTPFHKVHGLEPCGDFNRTAGNLCPMALCGFIPLKLENSLQFPRCAEKGSFSGPQSVRSCFDPAPTHKTAPSMRPDAWALIISAGLAH